MCVPWAPTHLAQGDSGAWWLAERRGDLVEAQATPPWGWSGHQIESHIRVKSGTLHGSVHGSQTDWTAPIHLVLPACGGGTMAKAVHLGRGGGTRPPAGLPLTLSPRQEGLCSGHDGLPWAACRLLPITLLECCGLAGPHLPLRPLGGLRVLQQYPVLPLLAGG